MKKINIKVKTIEQQLKEMIADNYRLIERNEKILRKLRR